MENNAAWDEIVAKITDFQIRKGIHSFINPYSMLVLYGEDSLAKNVDFWYIDGISLVNHINQDFNRNYKRYSFDDTSLAPIVFKWAKENHIKIAIIGTKPNLIEKAVFSIQARYDVNIEYFRNGYFDGKKERDKCYKQIQESNIGLVICGMGTPYQERFLIGLKDSGWEGVAFTCGGFLHQIAKKENYYPPIFDKLNIRWVYRIIDEPKLFMRYFYLYPKFFIRFKAYRRSKKHKKI